MKFFSAKCELCLRYKEEHQVHAFQRIITGGIKFVSLNGRQPWAGIGCICKECCSEISIALAAGESDNAQKS